MARGSPAFYVSQVNSEDQGLALGFAWLAEAAQTYEGEAIAVVPGLRQLDLLPPHPFKSASIGSLRNSSWRGGPVLLIWPDAKMLQEIHDHYGATALCIVPGYRGEHIDAWISATSAVDLSNVEPPPGPPRLGDSVAEVAFEHLTASITLHTGLNSSFAKSQAVETIEMLRDSGHRFDPTKLEAWAIAHGWQARHAQDLREMAEAISGGKRYQARRGIFVSNIVQLWEEEAEAKQ